MSARGGRDTGGPVYIMIQHLFDNSEFLQSVFDAVPSFMFIVDSDIRIHHLNASALSLLEREKGRVLFKSGGEVLHCVHAFESPERCGHAPLCKGCIVRDSVSRVFGGGRVRRQATKMELFMDGRAQDVYFSVTASPFNYMGEAFALVVLEDITKEKRLEEALEKRVAERTAELASANEALKESEERYKSLFEHSLDGIVLATPDGEILSVNPEACRILGRSEEEILEVGRDGVLDIEDPRVKSYLEERQRLGKVRAEVVCIRKGGEKFPCELSAALFKDRNGNMRVSALFRDITEKRRLESIAGELNMMDNIGYIFSGIRHELGNPLNTTKFNLEILRRQINAAPAEKIAEYVERAMDGVSRIEYLLRSLKSFNLFEEVKLKCASLPAFLDNFLAMARADFLLKGIKVDSSLDAGAQYALMDERAFNHALLNIFTNAADAVAETAEPRITIKTCRLEHWITVTVEDNGAGMTAGQMRDLFKPFHTTKPRGTGLGLVIVKKMMTKMNGGIEVASEKGVGTTVSLFLPACPAV